MMETALVFTSMLSILLFIVDIGRVLMVRQFFAERVRNGARTAAVVNYDATAIKNYICYNSFTAPAGGTSTLGYMGITPSNVNVQRLGTAGNWDDRIKISIQGYRISTWVPMLANTFTLPAVTATIPVGALGSTT